MFNKVDRNNREGIIGWDVTTTAICGAVARTDAMGGYEGAGITVSAKA